jgi:hypothetical protein
MSAGMTNYGYLQMTDKERILQVTQVLSGGTTAGQGDKC